MEKTRVRTEVEWLAGDGETEREKNLGRGRVGLVARRKVELRGSRVGGKGRERG